MAKKTKPEAFYTGGGIWLCAKYIDEHRYLVVDNDSTEFCLSCYDDTNEDEQGAFCCQNMIWSKDPEEMTKDERKQYKELRKVLEREI